MTLAVRPVPRFALRRDEAAAAVGVSLSKFEEWVRRGMMPNPVKVDGCTLYDARQVELAWVALRDGTAAEFGSSNPYDRT